MRTTLKQVADDAGLSIATVSRALRRKKRRYSANEEKIYAAARKLGYPFIGELDISDKTNPTLITEWEGIPKAHACWVSEDSNFLFTASETSGGYVMSWDVSDLNNITFLDEWLPDGAENYSVHNIFVKNNP